MSEYMSLELSVMVSQKLSEVMGDIGITEKIVKQRRKSFMIMEVIDTQTLRLLGKNVTTYNLGSQSEGSTTLMLDSDIDTLFEYRDLNLIQDWKKAEHDAQNVLMVQDDSTAPDHCFLQVQSSNITFPFPNEKFHEKNYLTDKKGRLLLKNTCFDDIVAIYNGRNGPAHTFQGNRDQNDEDNVIAWHCKSWPNEAKQWLEKDGKGIWPTQDMKRECKTTGCTIVPISSNGSQYGELEWRISTCLAERRLMFSLNITQMRCYVLLKMILKTFIKAKHPGTISSYICKNVLFHCLHNESSLYWQENQLIRCLESCLNLLEEFVKAENCPHFIIPQNNLLKGKISKEIKDNLLITLLDLKKNLELHLFKITSDDFGPRFMVKTDILPYVTIGQLLANPKDIKSCISAKLLRHIAGQLSIRHKNYLKNIMLFSKLELFHYLYDMAILRNLCDKTESETEKSAYQLLIPFFCSSLGCAMASYYFDNKSEFDFQDVISYLIIGKNSDVSSGKLKLASALYCFGEFDKTEDILQTLQQKYDKKIVETICKCNYHKVPYLRQGFQERAETGGEELLRDITSFCIRFLPREGNCVPRELQYEMFRSTAEDKLYRHPNDYWMNWAVVDSLPYLYFLQYKIYSRLQETGKQRKALSDLAETIKTEPNIGHRETALNLLGQCMEQENDCNKALNFYILSLQLRPRNNAARIHLCIMISTLIKRKYGTRTTMKRKENKKKHKKLRKRKR